MTGSSSYLAGSNDVAYWKCKLGHPWKAQINSRKRGSGCPYCAGQKVWPGFNDLATWNPDLAAEWDYELNGELLPSQVTVHSSMSVYWKCPKGHQSYRMRIADRSAGKGCRQCRDENAGKHFRKAVCQYSLEGNLLKEFDSATDAAKEMGVSVSAILNACKGKSKTSGGYRFRYLNESQ